VICLAVILFIVVAYLTFARGRHGATGTRAEADLTILS
jgi:hypothetical protein